MRDLPLSLLRSLAAVYAEGGVRPAAKRLSVEHSTISRALHELERWLGTPLIEARSRGQRLRLTQQGEVLAEAALTALRDLENATAKLREANSNKRVIIAAPPSVANRWLLPRLPRIEADCNGIEVSIIVDTVRMGDLDLYADLSLRMGPHAPTSAMVHYIGSDIAFPVMEIDAWKAAGKPTMIEALHGLPLLHDRDTRTAWSIWRDKIGPVDLDVASGSRFTSADLVLRAAEQGRGLALTRGWLAQDALSEGLLTRPFGELSIELHNEWWIAENSASAMRTPVIKVRDWLIAEGKALSLVAVQSEEGRFFV